MKTIFIYLFVITSISLVAQEEPIDFQPVDQGSILKKIAKTNPGTWSLTKDSNERHYGLMDKTFFKKFGNDRVGKIGTSKKIDNRDKIGFNYTAIHALVHQNIELETELKATQEKLNTLEKNYNRLRDTHEQMLKNLEKIEAVQDMQIMIKELEMRITDLEETQEEMRE